MEFWPADFRASTSSSSTRKGKRRRRTSINEQSLELGSSGAACLVSDRGSLKWITTVQRDRRHIPRVVGKTLEFFPPTRPPSPSQPPITTHQRAEQGSRFLRTHYPDVDIPFEIIKDQLELDEIDTRAHSALDSYAGNRLAHSFLGYNGDQHVHFLAFPSGKTASELNLSPFRVTEENQVIFNPSAKPVLSFDTPIQQIVAMLQTPGICRESSLLAVRTYSGVFMVDVQRAPVVPQEAFNFEARTVGAISPSDTGRRRIVDISGTYFSPSNSEFLVVNDVGAVYSMNGMGKPMFIAPSSGYSKSYFADNFWRVARRNVHTGIRCSSKTVQSFDIRDPGSAALFDLKDDAESFLTSIEAPMEGRHLMCFSTTKELIWLDERNQKVPVLSLKHQRAFDRTLRVHTVDCGGSPLTLLSSLANTLVTAYDVNYDLSGYVHVYGQPSAIASSSSMKLPLAGFAPFRHSIEDDSNLNIFQLSSDGSLWRTKVSFREDPENDELQAEVWWNEDVHAIAANYKVMSKELPPLAERQYVVTDLRDAYERIFSISGTASESMTPDPKSVHRTLGKMVFFWEEMDESVEHMLLTFDIAFWSGREPSPTSRADFFTKSLLSSPYGFVAFTREGSPLPQLIRTGRWYHDLASLPSRLMPDVSTNPQILIDRLREEASTHAATKLAMDFAIESASHVALDLVLSQHVYAPQPFPKNLPYEEEDDAGSLSQATQGMSLRATEPPPVQFGFLRPAVKALCEEDEEDVKMGDGSRTGNVGAELPLVVRLLLSQWETGTDPQKYVYEDPYDGAEAPPAQKLGKKEEFSNVPAHKRSIVPPVISMQRAPPIVATTSRPSETGSASQINSMFGHGDDSVFSVNRQPAASQEVLGPSQHIFSSQTEGPSTQPLPGAYGGGQRKGKKRIGGF